MTKQGVDFSIKGVKSWVGMDRRRCFHHTAWQNPWWMGMVHFCPICNLQKTRSICQHRASSSLHTACLIRHTRANCKSVADERTNEGKERPSRVMMLYPRSDSDHRLVGPTTCTCTVWKLHSPPVEESDGHTALICAESHSFLPFNFNG